MKKLILVVICLMLAGCDYTVPLVKTPTIDIDRSVLGLWQRLRDNGQTENLVVMPFNKREYMVSFPAGSKDAMYARGCLWYGADMTLVQLDWLGTARGNLPKSNRTFQFASYSVEDDAIRIRLLNPDVINKDIESPEKLVKAIADNRANPGLFREEMLFKKVED